MNPIMQTWTYDFGALTGGQIAINYATVGGAAGVSNLFANLQDFAGSDFPVTSSYLAANATGRVLLQFPESLGSVAILYNLPGIERSINLTGPILVGIYNETITNWNDAAIAKINPGVSMPNHIIQPVHRSDGSGTTYALSTYFSRVNSGWATKYGAGPVIAWQNDPTTQLGERSSGDLVLLVNETQYSIGYADSYYATYNHITSAAILNSAGNYVLPTESGAAAAAAADAQQIEGNLTYSITDAPGLSSYPISTFTYLLVFKDQTSAAKADAMTTFFWWVVHDGQTYSPRLYFAQLPSAVVITDEGIIRQINFNGTSYAP